MPYRPLSKSTEEEEEKRKESFRRIQRLTRFRNHRWIKINKAKDRDELEDMDILFPSTLPEFNPPVSDLNSVDCPECDIAAEQGDRCSICGGMGRVNLSDLF
jgi:hypothetical protein